MVIYVGDASSGGGWGDVFVADTNQPESPKIYTAQHGEIRVDGVKRTVQLVLGRGQTHFIDRRTTERSRRGAHERDADLYRGEKPLRLIAKRLNGLCSPVSSIHTRLYSSLTDAEDRDLRPCE